MPQLASLSSCISFIHLIFVSPYDVLEKRKESFKSGKYTLPVMK